MHTINANCETIRIYHHRTWAQIFERPHICRGRQGWLVYHLSGAQTRVRTKFVDTLEEAVAEAQRIHHYNQRPEVAFRRMTALGKEG